MNTKVIRVFFLVANILGLVLSYIEEEVTWIPEIGTLNSKWYSGYMPVTDTKSLHYVLV